MVRMVDLTDDYYEYDEKNYCIIGRRNKKIYTLGDQVRVKVKKTDIDRRLIDLVLAKDGDNPLPAQRKKSRPERGYR
jgi:ribonuclease R